MTSAPFAAISIPRVDVDMGSGERHHLQPIAYSYTNHGRTCWVMTDILSLIHDNGTPVDVHKIVGRSSSFWRGMLIRFGLSFEDTIFPSMKTVRYQMQVTHEPVSPSEFTRQEWTFDTKAWVVLSFLWSYTLRPVEKREKATRVLVEVLSSVCQAGSLEAMLESNYDACTDFCCEAASMCSHVRTARENLSAAPAATPMAQFIQFLFDLMGQSEDCRRCHCLAEGLVALLADHVHDCLPELNVNMDPLSISRDSTIGGRRRRWNEAFMEELASGVVVKRSALSGTQLAKSKGVSTRRVKAAEQKTVLVTMQAAVREFGGMIGTVNIASDGSRLGRPGREWVHVLAYVPEMDLGMWLPSQAVPPTKILRDRNPPAATSVF